MTAKLPCTLARRLSLIVAIVGSLAAPAWGDKWSVARVNHMTVVPPAGMTIAEMSGVTYLGPMGDAHRFLVAEENKGELLQFDVTFSAAGAVTAFSSVAAIDITPTNDFEGIAFTNAARNSVFLSSENGVALREVSLAGGAELQAVAIPAVFNNRRGNLGNESLARSRDGATMWTANEQALTVDGDISTSTTGTTVRLLKLGVAGNVVAPGPQYAYQVEPIHGSSMFGSPLQSGLSDLTLMPDGTLLALERSVALTSPLYLNRIYEVDATGATDVSVAPFASGLIGQAYTPVAKELLWSGAADGGGGQNLEGLTLGPRLANGAWTLLGVIDNQSGADPQSGNTIVAFVATPIPSADFDKDGNVDGEDFLIWQRGFGQSVGAVHGAGDANRDGAVDAADLALWQGAFAAAVQTSTTSVPEPTAALLCGAMLAIVAAGRKESCRRHANG